MVDRSHGPDATTGIDVMARKSGRVACVNPRGDRARADHRTNDPATSLRVRGG